MKEQPNRPTNDVAVMLQAMGELMVTLVAMHMSGEKLKQTANEARAFADYTEGTQRTGVQAYSDAEPSDPAVLRAVADLYDQARDHQAGKLEQFKIAKAGHASVATLSTDALS